MATRTEARTLIQALHLIPIASTPFPRYRGEGIELIVTGIGPLHAASAVGHILTHSPATQLLNLGICAGDRPGQLYNISKVIDDPSGKSYPLPPSTTLPNKKLRTLHHPAHKRFRELVDMEAAGILVGAKPFQVKPHIIKLVSDPYDPKRCSPEWVLTLFQRHLKELLDIIANLKRGGT
ncbi:MAG: hypothetical protein C6I00_01445 [Nitratiruptor sp.]|nr:hypothetical protein [Nitratiruptor sp.]NPA83262.1 hypothetical protein [Campylobacterota bacterium]